MKFKRNNHIICIECDTSCKYLTSGKTYKVIETDYDNGSDMVKIMCDNGSERWFQDARFVLNTTIPKFSAGDIVINNEDSDSDLTIGQTYKVVSSDFTHGTEGHIQIYDDAGDFRNRPAAWYITVQEYIENIHKKVEELKKPTYHVGDKFCINGRIFTIIETILDGDKMYALVCKEGSFHTSLRTDLKFVLDNNFVKQL